MPEATSPDTLCLLDACSDSPHPDRWIKAVPSRSRFHRSNTARGNNVKGFTRALRQPRSPDPERVAVSVSLSVLSPAPNSVVVVVAFARLRVPSEVDPNQPGVTATGHNLTWSSCHHTTSITVKIPAVRRYRLPVCLRGIASASEYPRISFSAGQDLSLCGTDFSNLAIGCISLVCNVTSIARIPTLIG
jgi:hypothetical protein